MLHEWTTLWSLSWLLAGGFLFLTGGRRFRRWAVEGRAGLPRFPNHVETVLLWLLYSSLIAFVIVLIKQVLRHV